MWMTICVWNTDGWGGETTVQTGLVLFCLQAWKPIRYVVFHNSTVPRPQCLSTCSTFGIHSYTLRVKCAFVLASTETRLMICCKSALKTFRYALKILRNCGNVILCKNPRFAKTEFLIRKALWQEWYYQFLCKCSRPTECLFRHSVEDFKKTNNRKSRGISSEQRNSGNTSRHVQYNS